MDIRGTFVLITLNSSKNQFKKENVHIFSFESMYFNCNDYSRLRILEMR